MHSLSAKIALCAAVVLSSACLNKAARSSSLPDVPFERVVIDAANVEGRKYMGDVKGLGDLDGDGAPDIVFGGNELAWYAAPAWTKSVIAVPDEEFSTDMQLADIDGDGDLDVVAPDGSKGKISWFENPRPGGDMRSLWKRHLIGYQQDWAHDLEVGDIDGDGRLDVVTRKTATIVWLQKARDAFTAVTVETALPKGEGTALADINGDGRLDIVQNGYWLEGPADPARDPWRKHFIARGWPAQLSVAAANINGDAAPDVVMAPAESAGRLCWYEAPRDPAGAPWKEHVIDPSVQFVHGLRVGDFNNDGRADVAIAEMHQSKQRRVMVYLRDGSAWKPQVLAATGSHNIRAGDVDADGDLDIIGANWGGPHHPLELWRNKLIDGVHSAAGWNYVAVDTRRAKWGDFAPPADLRYFGLAAGDLTGDGHADLVSGRYFYRNPGRDAAAPWVRTDFGINVDAMLLVDVDADKQLDVIAEALPAVYWLKPVGREALNWRATLVATLPPTEHVNGQGYALAQIVPGGPPEIVLSAGDGVYSIEIPARPDACPWPRTRIAAGASEEGVAAGDIDGDGLIDIATSDKDGHRIFWWKNPGNGGADWARRPVGATKEWADRCAAADINGDGRLDIVVTEETAYAGASVYWFEQPAGDSEWIRHTITTQFSTNSLDVGDLDGDGDTDILTGEHRGTRKLAVWENIGGGARWIEHVIDAGKENHLGARLAGLGDGAPAIVGIAWDSYSYLHLWKPSRAAMLGRTPTFGHPRERRLAANR